VNRQERRSDKPSDARETPHVLLRFGTAVSGPRAMRGAGDWECRPQRVVTTSETCLSREGGTGTRRPAFTDLEPATRIARGLTQLEPAPRIARGRHARSDFEIHVRACNWNP